MHLSMEVSCLAISLVVEKGSLVMFPHTHRQIKHVELKLGKENLLVNTRFYFLD